MPTILIVDDHPSFRSTARVLLQAEGFDVVLLDVQLPDFDGFEVARRLATTNGGSPVVILTSSRDAADFGPLVEQSGARGFVPKAELSGAALSALLD